MLNVMRPALVGFADRRFLVALSILFVNDHILKHAWPCWFTGKLSDFAGLFAFGWFCVALVPRWPRAALLVVSVLFVWWKSPLSQPAIDGWNALPLFRVGRVVDASDLFALLVLPWVLMPARAIHVPWKRWSLVAIGVCAIMLFGATTMARRTLKPTDITSLYYDKAHYTLRATPDGFWHALDTCSAVLPLDTLSTSTGTAGLRRYELKNVRLREVAARSVQFVLWKRGRKMRFELLKIEPDHPIHVFTEDEVRAYADLYRRLFEQAVLRCIDRRAVPHHLHAQSRSRSM
jgi:hypothetical protein